LFFAVNELVDRFLLEYYLPKDVYPDKENIAVVGIYAACYKLSIFITLAIQAYKYAAEPFFFGQVEDKQNKTIFAQSAKYFLIATLFMFVAVSVNVDLIGSLILRKAIYRTGLGVVPFLLLANVFLGVYYNLAIWFKITDRTHFGAIIGGIGATITLVLNLLLIPYIGYYGSAITTLVCYASMTALCYYFGNKFYPVPYDLKSAGLYLFAAIILVGLSFSHGYEGLIGEFIINNSLVLCFVGLFYWKEKDSLLKLLGKKS
jgi:O-antigen/teichoic acid export membrane protein